jgi:hypothetical protein
VLVIAFLGVSTLDAQSATLIANPKVNATGFSGDNATRFNGF